MASILLFYSERERVNVSLFCTVVASWRKSHFWEERHGKGQRWTGRQTERNKGLCFNSKRPYSDQPFISLYNINKMPGGQVMRVTELINKEESFLNILS